MDEHASFETQAVLAPRRGRGNRLGILVAVFVIAATVATGLLGQRMGRGPTADLAFPTADAEAVAVGPTEPPQSLANFHPDSQPKYPSKVLGLQVWSAAYVSIYGLNYFGGSIAVAGWYAAQPGTGCPTPRVAEDPALAEEFGVAADADTFCDRSGELFTAPMFDENVAPIGVDLRPGVAAPYELKDDSLLTPVVFVGTLLNPGLQCHAPRACPVTLVVDHVAWAAGNGLPRTSAVLPRLLDRWPPMAADERDQVSARAIGYGGSVLLEALVDPATLARIDPHAAVVLTAAAPAAERIWYRRVLGPDPAQDAMRWVGIDDATGRLIASGFGS